MNSILDRATGFALTQSLANVTQERAFTIFDGTAYHPATQDDLDIYWYDLDALGAAIIEEFRPDAIGAVNWSDRPDYADPPDPGPGDGTGLGDRGEEGDDADNPDYRADALTLCIAALTAAQRGVFGGEETKAKIALALAACHAEEAALARIKAEVLRRIARQPADVCRWCGGRASHPEVL